MSDDFIRFINDHKSQLVSSDVPEYLWYGLHVKLTEQIYDIGDKCSLQASADETSVICVANHDIKASGPESIYLLDHAWTTPLNKMESTLKQNEGLRERIGYLMCSSYSDYDADEATELIMNDIWSHLSYYDITFNGESKKLWYIHDEVGNFVSHDDKNPNVKMAPFLYVNNRNSYSIMWLIKDITNGDTFRVNKSGHIVDEYLNKCLSYVWTRLPPPNDLVGPLGKTLTTDFFKTHRTEETKIDLTVKNLGKIPVDKLPLTVYTDIEFVKTTLTDSRFVLIDDKYECDILWIFEHFRDYRQLSQQTPRTMINQFPNEAILTTKDLLAALASKSSWYPKTFNLKTEIAEFINYFKELEDKDEEESIESVVSIKVECQCNCHTLKIDCGVCTTDSTKCGDIKERCKQVWIVKPWNLARGMGIYITTSLDKILRMTEAYPKEPKIASRYIIDTVLFYRYDLGINVKFDIRYMLLLSSVEPLKAYVSKIFWLRFGNKKYVLAKWSDYETHFTVMNYHDGTSLKNMMYDDFIKEFEKQYPTFSWKYLEGKIYTCLQNMLLDVTHYGKTAPAMSLTSSPQSRAMFAVDLMLEWNTITNAATSSQANRKDIEPRVCEVNYCPDCTRACEFFPNFFNEVFSTLFLGDVANCDELF